MALLIALTVALIAAPGMSSIEQVTAPYIAPWQTGFQRYSTQLVTPSLINAGATRVAQLDVPAGQYWRIISWSAQFNASAVAANRTFTFTAALLPNTTYFQTGFPAGLTASQIAILTIAGNVTTFANTSNPNIIYENLEIPDVIWSPGIEFSLNMGSAQAGDSVSSGTNSVLVEVYIPENGSAPPTTPYVRPTPLFG